MRGRGRTVLSFLVCIAMMLSQFAFAVDELSTDVTGNADNTEQVEESIQEQEPAKTEKTEEADKPAEEVLEKEQVTEEKVPEPKADDKDKSDTMPAFKDSAILDGVKVEVSAEEGTFPKGAVLSVEMLSDADEKKIEDAMDDVREDDVNVALSYSFDIKILDKEGEELQPADGKKADVSFKINEVEDANLGAAVYHMADTDSGLKAEELKSEKDKDVISAETDGFSFYTVEFTYNDLQYVMEGDTSVELADILAKIGLSGEPTDVKVSNKELFSAEKKEGKWMVTAHKAFKSEEWMKVTIAGIEYDIVVTDEDWLHYSIDLEWDIGDPSQKYEQKVVTAGSAILQPKYRLTIQTSSVIYNPESMEIRIPLYIFEQREGMVTRDSNGTVRPYNPKKISPSEISVPEYPETNATYSFSYRIDEENEELVFINNKAIPAGTNETIEVKYDVDPMYIVDLDKAEFQAKAKATPAAEQAGQYEEEERESPVITYQLDVGLQSISEQTYKTKGKGFEPVVIKDGYRYYKLHLSYFPHGNSPFYHSLSFDFGDTGGEIVGPKDNFDNGVAMTMAEAENYYKYSSHIATSISPNEHRAETEKLDIYVRWPDSEEPEADSLWVTLNAVAYDDDTHEPPADMNDRLQHKMWCSYTWPKYPEKPRGDWYKNPIGQERSRGEFLVPKNLGLYYTNEGVTRYHGAARFTIGVEDDHVVFNNAGGNSTLIITDTGLVSESVDTDTQQGVPNGAPELQYEISYLGLPILQEQKKVKIFNEETNTIEEFEGKWFDEAIVEGSVDGENWEEVYVATERVDNVIGSFYNSSDIYDLWVGKGYKQARVRFTNVIDNVVISGDIVKLFVHGTDITEEYLKRQELDQYTNWATIDLYDHNNNKEYSVTDWGMLTLTPFDETGKSNLSKKVTNVVNNPGKENVDVEFSVEGTYEYSVSGYPQDSNSEIMYDIKKTAPELFDGLLHLDDVKTVVFYDLLPEGYSFDSINSKMYSYTPPISDAYARLTDYSEWFEVPVSYEVFENYKGTRRQLVVFTVDVEDVVAGSLEKELSITRLKVNFDYVANISWDDLVYFQNENNLIEMQRGDAKAVFEGVPDNGLPSNSSNNYAVFEEAVGSDGSYAFDDINGDGDSETNNIVASYATVSPNVVMSATTGINKFIMGDSGKWTDLDHTDINKEYYYRVRVQNGENTNVTDLIIYDTLEEAANTQLEEGEVTWKGSFKSIDVTPLEEQGIAPVVYYSTADPKLLDYNNVTGRKDEIWIDDESLWSTELPDDPADVTAVAVDCRKLKNGEDLVLGQNKGVQFYITMTAPPEYPTLKDPDMVYAINRPAYHSYQYVNYAADGTYFTDIGRRVKIYLEPRGSLTIKKLFENRENDPEEKDPEFTVEGPNGFKDTFKYSDMVDGQYVIEDLALGEYKVYESFSDPNNGYTVSFDGAANMTEESNDDGNRTIGAEVELSHNPDKHNKNDFQKTVTITNTYKYIDISGSKYWEDDDDELGLRPDEITVRLMADGKVVDTVTVTEEDDWRYTFSDLPKYHDDKEIEYTIKEDPVDGYEATYDGFDITNECTQIKPSTKLNGTLIKEWDDNNDRLGIRPKSVKVHILNGDNEYVDSFVLSKENGWSYEIKDLPEYDDEGKEIDYYVYEEPVEGYTFTKIKEIDDNTAAMVNSIKKGADTGDKNDIAGLIGLMAICAAALSVVALKRRKEY